METVNPVGREMLLEALKWKKQKVSCVCLDGGEREEVLKRAQSVKVKVQLQRVTETSEETAAEETGLFLRLRDLHSVTAALGRVPLQF